ncbi:HDOD domain-containing protein [Uliginosibacterium sp. H3]|uniref:HDOD domain-containing protein n=1 Tax=Uliginosibacterium silvisoli TaxID=3114758 RepID=A0ABU6K1L2_9RHOO|nr:HDOD domain-containing protein [Uliginosibacterium sp. H3]
MIVAEPTSAGRRVQFSADLERELASGELVFPTSMQAAVKIRRALDEEDASTATVARIINLEPLLSVKMLRMANSAFFNTSGQEVTDVHRALMRVGMNNARVLALAVIGDQMATASEFAPVWRLAEQLWRHTLDVASLAYAIALQIEDVSPDTALLAGMVHDIGQFYLLSRVHAYPELLQEQDEMSEFILSWQKEVGQQVLKSLGTPELIIRALDEQENPSGAWPPNKLADVLFLANSAAGTPNPFSTLSLEMQIALRQAAFAGVDREVVNQLLDEARVQRAVALSMLTA